MNESHLVFLLEHLNDQFQAVVEAVSQMHHEMMKFATKDDLSAVADDVRIIKVAVTDTSHDLIKLDNRVARLEQVIARG